MVDEVAPSKWQLHTVFVQANSVQGYRYFDLTGVVLNRIASRYENTTIEPVSCLLRGPKDPKDPYAIHFSVDRIWLQYAPVESLTYVVDTAPEWIRAIAQDLEVTKFSRLGLRPIFFVPSTNIINASSLLARNVSDDLLRRTIEEVDDREDADFEYRVRVRAGQSIATIRIGTVIIRREPQSPQDYASDGLLFDTDIYERVKAPDSIPRAQTKRFLVHASQLARDLLEEIGYNLLRSVHGGGA